MKVGFIGLGIMGKSMAANLQKSGHELVVHDLKRDAAAPHIQAGAVWADTPRKVAEATEIVFTSLPGPPDMESVALGEQGLLSGLQKGKAYFDLTTNSPTVVRKVHAVFADKGVHLLDAPVSGGPHGARTGKLAIWVGGEEDVFKRYKPVLDGFSDQAVYVGAIGAGSVTKLVHNMAGYAIQTALAEVFTMGVKAGVEPLALWQAVRQGAGGRQRTFDRVPHQFFRGKYDPPNFALRLAHKDVTLATALGREFSVPMRVANLALADLTEALNRGWGERDSRIPMSLQEERAGVQCRVEESRLREALDREGLTS
jgi:3-hydroxyisobutyrate dehydrogenase-like beta-hydroxyacid dehydrogenase